MKKKKKAKRLGTPKAKRLPKKIASPYNVVIRNWEDPLSTHEKKVLNENSRLEFHINNAIYVVSIDKAHNCLLFTAHEKHLFLQPLSMHQFLVKAYTPPKK